VEQGGILAKTLTVLAGAATVGFNATMLGLTVEEVGTNPLQAPLAFFASSSALLLGVGIAAKGFWEGPVFSDRDGAEAGNHQSR
jgi:hypothetical protein